MAFTKTWVETEPDGAVITVSQLDNYQRDAKIAIRERLEGDPANLLSGIVDVGTFAASCGPKLGAARFYCNTEANLNLAAHPNQDGRGYFSNDSGTGHPKVFSKEAAGAREIAYLNRNGTRPMVGTTTVDIDITTGNTNVDGIVVDLSTAAAVLTVDVLTGILIRSPVRGAGSTITLLHGLKIDDLNEGTTRYAILTGIGQIKFKDNFQIFENGDVKVSNDSMSTGSTAGFLYIPACAGAPTGTPTSRAGHVPIIYDDTNNRIYVYDAGWKFVGVA